MNPRVKSRLVSALRITALLLSLAIRGHAAADAVPPGAAELGYSKQVINEHPAVSDIAPGRNGNYKWFSGQWYNKTSPSPDHYTTNQGVLTLSLDGDLSSAPLDFSESVLPALPGDKGFYAEFEVQLSDNDPDHWPAVWLMPVEHDNKQRDSSPPDPPGFERWMELDVDEGGFGPGLLGTVIDWKGIWPHYERTLNENHFSKIPLDRTQKHIFGASYDPVQGRVTWWVDGARQMSAQTVSAVAAHQHFYLILSAQTHGKQKPYTMMVSAVRAFVSPDSPLPAK